MPVATRTLRPAIIFALLGVAFIAALSAYKSSLMGRYSAEKLGSLAQIHPEVRNLFQASFYFYYRDQFLPGINSRLQSETDLERIEIATPSGALIFDSNEPPAEPPKVSGFQLKENALPEILAKALGGDEPRIFTSNFETKIAVPSGPFGVVYTYDAAEVRSRVFLSFGAGVALIAFLAFVLHRMRASGIGSGVLQQGNPLRGLRGKFLLTIVLVNVITGGIIFVTLSELQTREQSARIRDESLLFSRFTTPKVISDFSNHFYFYYEERFLPSIRSILDSNDNLVGIKIVSNRTRAVLFDSQGQERDLAKGGVNPDRRFSFTGEEQAALSTRGLLERSMEKDGENYLSVVNTYYNESQEPLFLVEFLFSFRSLKKSIEAIRRQILIDLVPSLAFGLLVAFGFAQLLISPIRRLVGALRKVTEGDYEVSVASDRTDEVGELQKAFNQMTVELRKKKELRKYLSDSTYRQIMAAPMSKDGSQIGGSRIPATILFCDIRGFVTHCESMDAEEVTSMLNDYFTEMVDVIHRNGGEVDKFIGDAILAVFYPPVEDSTGGGGAEAATALQAIYCALEMRDRLAEFNDRRSARNETPLEIGIGINHGEIISGPIGSNDRRDFTVIGDVVNLASRIEKLSKKGRHTRVVFSSHVEEKVRGLLEYEDLDVEEIRGKEEKVRVFELVRIRDIEALMANLAPSAAENLRIRSIELLGQSRNPVALSTLIGLLEDKSERIILTAIAAIRRLAPDDDEMALDSLFSLLDRSKSSSLVTSAAISAVGRICRSDRLLELSEYLEHSDERVVANTVEAVGQLRSPACNDLLLSKLSSRSNRIKANAAMALFAGGHIEVIDSLKPMLMHSDPLMRSSAAFAIGELTLLAKRDFLLEEWKKSASRIKFFMAELQECVPMLVSLLKDPEPVVKRQAVIALGKIKDKSAVLAILDNVDLENDSREMIRDISQALREIGSHKLVREVLDRFS